MQERKRKFESELNNNGDKMRSSNICLIEVSMIENGIEA